MKKEPRLRYKCFICDCPHRTLEEAWVHFWRLHRGQGSDPRWFSGCQWEAEIATGHYIVGYMSQSPCPVCGQHITMQRRRWAFAMLKHCLLRKNAESHRVALAMMGWIHNHTGERVHAK